MFPSKITTNKLNEIKLRCKNKIKFICATKKSVNTDYNT